ncbi:ABC-type bacteriocin/lantibiotic exporter, contains an N-terminal double-glycine peptidase domain [Tissierella praeacuta DSM 18095]|uniref:ABC-type bacteriocin/lantibiotic exporter, contains an N-terminal double-glycine peptidase domain n=1 Tax=Tissierella praeacuta DSM 18095 TaxID=1123404 RepID=A0A1M4TZD0_9FIRM|nr:MULTISPECIES: peptidase domain-containing ABC transporter [Bacillota]SHE49848.1 ABC-type bacteriocin/lantibiotic exporter, contains an N-terminal double-glycine peptidase domain [Tissierella praeacuta DSM 18095]SUP04139.1 Lactococcin-G-processing and transport ATP-binding protein LagD [Tissierella praeacuta]
MKQVKFIQQLSETGCGVAAICMILDFYGCKTHIAELNKKINISRDGVSLRELIKVSKIYGLTARAMQLQDKENIRQIYNELPCICLKNNNHYIVLCKIKNDFVSYLDPEIGKVTVSIEEFNKSFTGIMLLLTPNKEFKKRKKKNYSFSLLKLGFLDKKMIVLAIFLSVVIQMMTLFTPWITKYVIDDVVGKSANTNIFILFIYSIIFAFAYGLFSFIRYKIISLLEKKYVSSLKKIIVEKTFKLPLKFFDIRSAGEIISRINSIDALQQIITNIVTSIFIDFTTVVIVAIVMLRSSVKLAYIIFAMGFILCVFLLFFLKTVDKKNLNSIMSREKTQSYLMESFSNITIMKTLGANKIVVGKWGEFYNKQISSEYIREKTLGLYQSFMLSYRLLPTFVILFIGSLLINDKVMSIGEMMAFISLTNLFLNPLATIMQNVFDFQYSTSIIDRLTEIVFEDEEPVNDGKYIKNFEQLEFNNVDFSYDGRCGEKVLNNITFNLKKGDRISFVGRTGCGKTTIVKLILMLYPYYNGNILINSENINKYNLKSYRKLFGIVLQDQMFFNDTIRNNIDIAQSHTDDEVKQAIKIACFEADVEKMPFKMDTQIGDNGHNLSGGQRQRLAIARILINEPQIVILDEGTNQLDAITEDRIMKNLKEKNISLITITHRLSTIVSSDKIFFLDNGKIVDSGEHIELKERNESYSRLFEKQ